jgi:TonB family protein
VVAAILIHAGIFAVTWPTIAQAPPAEPERVLYRYPLTDFVPTPREPEEMLIELPLARPDGPPIIDGPPEETDFRPVVVHDVLPPTGPAIIVAYLPEEPPDPPDPTPTFVTVNVEIDPPAVIHRVEPRFTDAARFAKIQGTVILDLVIDTEGRVESIHVLRGLPLGLTKNAVDAVEQWRFQPSIYNERPVAVRYILTVRFHLA